MHRLVQTPTDQSYQMRYVMLEVASNSRVKKQQIIKEGATFKLRQGIVTVVQSNIK